MVDEEEDTTQICTKSRELKRNQSCKVASCGLRPKSYPQHTVEPIFTKNATRNLGCVSVFSSLYVQPYGWVLFFYFLLYI